MATKAEAGLDKIKAAIGTTEGAGEWFTIDQELINLFADATHDHQWIHVDPARCAEMSPWKTPIAHGFLTLSMLTHLSSSIPTDPAPFAGVVMGVNYGFDKVRFITPVKVGSRIRATSVLSDARLKDPNSVQVTRTVTVEIEGEAKPALVAEWLTMVVYG